MVELLRIILSINVFCVLKKQFQVFSLFCKKLCQFEVCEVNKDTLVLQDFLTSRWGCISCTSIRKTSSGVMPEVEFCYHVELDGENLKSKKLNQNALKQEVLFCYILLRIVRVKIKIKL